MKKLLALTIISSCLVCNSALAAPSTSEIDTVQASTKTKAVKSKYNTWMRIGYNAYNKKDYNTALINFKRALKLRPNDVYATKAIQNTENRLAGK